jgi:hypothetical protein
MALISFDWPGQAGSCGCAHLRERNAPWREPGFTGIEKPVFADFNRSILMFPSMRINNLARDCKMKQPLRRWHNNVTNGLNRGPDC